MGCVMFHILYETKEIFVRKILELIKITKPSRKNFANNKNNEISDNAKIKYRIDKKNILGHSDIAPERKKDPGEKFPWKYLAKFK